MGTFVVLRAASSVRTLVLPASWRSDEVALWPADLDEWDWNGQEPGALLSTDERARAARFVFEKDRRRFVTGRAVLRTLLGRSLGRPAAGLSFRYGTQGKPMLADRDLWFNVSAAAGKALYAVSPGRRVGVDIERIRDIAEMEAVAERAFSMTEKDWLRARPAARRRSAFFRCWTRKEAVVKGLGAGFSMPPDRFDVGPGRSGLVRVTVASPGEIGHWIVRDIAAFPGYAAAAAAEAPGVRQEALSVIEERA